jgi:AsmA protein
MRGRRRSRRLSPTALALLWVGAGLAAPVILTLNSLDIDMRGATVIAAPRDSYTLAAPIVINSSPPIRIERGTILLVDTTGSESSGEATEALLKSGAAHLVLDTATLVIGGRTSGDAGPQGPVAPLVEALSTLNFEGLTLRRTELSVGLPGAYTETLSDVQAEISLKKKGWVSAKGSGTVRGQRVSFDTTAGTSIDRKGQRIPLKVMLKGEPLEFVFDGRLGVGDEAHLQGHAEVVIGSVRHAARWLGAGWPSGPGLKQFSLKGELDWTSQSLAFQRSTFRMDGNEASGALELSLAGTRPAIVGTLALKTLDLTRYLGSPQEDAPSSFSWASLSSGPLGMPLGMLLDADVRLSADRVSAAGMEFGRSAASISLRSGLLLADIAELQFNGGSGIGQIGADFTGLRPKLLVRGKLEQVDLGRTLAPLGGHTFVQGVGTLVADFTAAGQTGAEVLNSLNGKLSVRAAGNGRLGVDMKGLLAATQANTLEGWVLAARGTTSFDELELRLDVQNGVIAIEDAHVVAGDTSWTGAGSLDIPAFYVNLRVVAGSAASPAVSLSDVAKLPGLQVRGLWSSPLIKFSAEPDPAAAPVEPFAPFIPLISIPDRG